MLKDQTATKSVKGSPTRKKGGTEKDDNQGQITSLINITEDIQAEVVTLWRVNQVIDTHIAPILSDDILKEFRRNVEHNLKLYE